MRPTKSLKATVVLFLIVMAGIALSAAKLYSDDSKDEAEFIGSDQCLSCHDGVDQSFMKTKHSILFLNEGPDSKRGCEGCHGPGSKHLEDAPEGIIRFNGDSVEKENAMCLNCHAKGDKQNWRMSAHAGEDMACADCHSPHGKVSERSAREKKEIKYLLVDSEVDLCLSCHQEKRAEFSKPSHMPVLEGKMACSDCHSPHNNSALEMDRVDASCVNCHQEKAGPFLYDHDAASESCLNCHESHGSMNQNLLTLRQPTLCLQCHAGTNVFHDTGTAQYKTCTNCHKANHGSNSSDKYFN